VKALRTIVARPILALSFVSLVLLTVASCGEPTPSGADTKGIQDLVDRLDQRGIRCENLAIDEVDAEDTGGFTVGGVRVTPPVAEEFGSCVLPNAAEFQGAPVASQIYYFDDREHLKSAKASVLPPQFAMVYDDKWEFLVSPPDMANEIGDALSAMGVRHRTDAPTDSNSPDVLNSGGN
jgi:hypothetical protein